MINLLATLVIYQHANYLEYDTIYRTKITQTRRSLGTSQLTLVQYLSYHPRPQVCLRLG